MGKEVICVNFAKTFIHQIIKTPITKIIYTREKMAYSFTLQQVIVLWILIIKLIIALFAVESWWKNDIVQNSIVYLLSLIVMAHKEIQKY